MGRINLLFDKTQTPHLTAEELCQAFGVSASNASAKSGAVLKALDAMQLDPRWCRAALLEDNPLAWMIEVDGILADARHLPLELQEIAYGKGLIPYIPSQREPGPVFGQLDEGREIVVEWADPSEIPPLDEHAEALLKAMQEAGQPLSRRQLLKKTEMPLSEWSNSLGLLMAHGLVELGHCNRRGQVYSCKGQAREAQPSAPARPVAKPMPPAESMPFFGMEGQIDWAGDKAKP